MWHPLTKKKITLTLFSKSKGGGSRRQQSGSGVSYLNILSIPLTTSCNDTSANSISQVIKKNSCLQKATVRQIGICSYLYSFGISI